MDVGEEDVETVALPVWLPVWTGTTVVKTRVETSELCTLLPLLVTMPTKVEREVDTTVVNAVEVELELAEVDEPEAEAEREPLALLAEEADCWETMSKKRTERKEKRYLGESEERQGEEEEQGLVHGS